MAGVVEVGGAAASGLAALLACLALMRGLLNHRTFAGIPNGAFPGAGVMFVGAVAASATWRSWGVRSPVSVVLAGAAALTLAGSCFVLLDLIQLVLTGSFGAPDDAKSNGVTFGERLGSAALGLLFVATATSWRRRTSGVCSRCGNAHSSEVVRVERPEACAASRRVCRIAYSGCCAFVPYLSLHGLHFAGLAPWFDHLYSEQSLFPGNPLLVFALFAIGLVGPAVFLLLSSSPSSLAAWAVTALCSSTASSNHQQPARHGRDPCHSAESLDCMHVRRP